MKDCTKDFCYYSTDDSFDYLGPFGSETCYERGCHGFSISFDERGVPILESIEGFGSMVDIEYYKSCWEGILRYLEEVQSLLDFEDEYSVSLEELGELENKIKELISYQRVDIRNKGVKDERAVEENVY